MARLLEMLSRRALAQLLAACAVLSTSLAPAAASLLPVGPPILLRDRVIAVAAALPDGGLLVSSTAADGDGSGVFVRRYAADGKVLSGAIRINLATAGDQQDPNLARLTSGGFVAVWMTQTLAPPSFGGTLQARFLDAAGVPVGGEIPIGAGAPAWFPQVAPLAAGGFVVSWQTTPTALARRFAADGSPLGPEVPVSRAFVAYSGALAALPGGFVAVTEDPLRIVAYRFGADGEPLGDPLVVTEVGPDEAVAGILAAAGPRGELVVVWTAYLRDASQETVTEVRARLFDGTGAPRGAVFRLDPEDAEEEFASGVAMDPSGSFVVAATTSIDLRPATLGSAWARHFDARGTATGPRLTLAPYPSTVTTSTNAGQVMSFGGGEWGVLWSLETATGVDHFAQRLRSGCGGTAAALCLHGGRFQAEVDWKLAGGAAGAGQALPLTDDTGAFWFFGPDNVELLVKVLDGRAVNGRYWVFFTPLTDVEHTLAVTDTETGARRTYHSPAGKPASGADTDAF